MKRKFNLHIYVCIFYFVGRTYIRMYIYIHNNNKSYIKKKYKANKSNKLLEGGRERGGATFLSFLYLDLVIL